MNNPTKTSEFTLILFGQMSRHIASDELNEDLDAFLLGKCKASSSLGKVSYDAPN